MRILDLGEAGYEGQTEAQRHYFYIEAISFSFLV